MEVLNGSPLHDLCSSALILSVRSLNQNRGRAPRRLKKRTASRLPERRALLRSQRLHQFLTLRRNPDSRVVALTKTCSQKLLRLGEAALLGFQIVGTSARLAGWLTQSRLRRKHILLVRTNLLRRWRKPSFWRAIPILLVHRFWIARRSKLLKKLLSDCTFNAPWQSPIEATLRHRFQKCRQLFLLLLAQFSLARAIPQRLLIVQNHGPRHKRHDHWPAARHILHKLEPRQPRVHGRLRIAVPHLAHSLKPIQLGQPPRSH